MAGKITHVVLFWLKNKGNVEDRDALIAGIRNLASINVVRSCHIGVPADTEVRDVVDHSFDVSETLVFDSVEDQLAYQNDPVHVEFVARNEHLWDRVLVYDIADAD